jgi:hypothetical protein
MKIELKRKHSCPSISSAVQRRFLKNYDNPNRTESEGNNTGKCLPFTVDMFVQKGV